MKTCTNCGHDREVHGYYEFRGTMGARCNYCKCKEFIPSNSYLKKGNASNHSPTPSDKDTPEVNSKTFSNALEPSGVNSHQEKFPFHGNIKQMKGGNENE